MRREAVRYAHFELIAHTSRRQSLRTCMVISYQLSVFAYSHGHSLDSSGDALRMTRRPNAAKTSKLVFIAEAQSQAHSAMTRKPNAVKQASFFFIAEAQSQVHGAMTGHRTLVLVFFYHHHTIVPPKP